jgi:hypothetical protein
MYPPPNQVQQQPTSMYPPPNQVQQQPRKKHTVAIVLGIIGGLILCACLSCLGLYFVGSILEQAETREQGAGGHQAQDTPRPEPPPPPVPESDEDDVADTKKVGNAEMGYIEVPKDWVESVGSADSLGTLFARTSGEPVVTAQFSNPAGDQIVTLYAIDTEKMGAKEFESLIFVNMDANGYTQLYRAASDLISGYTAYLARGFTEDGRMLVFCCFEDGLGTTHYIAVEMTRDAPRDLGKIPLSFSLE